MRSEDKEALSQATISESIDIETDADISGLNRDAEKLQIILKDEKSHHSLMIPLADPHKLRENLKQIGRTFASIKEKINNKFANWQTIAKTEGLPDEFPEKMVNLAVETQKVIERIETSALPEDRKIELATKVELVLDQTIDGTGVDFVVKEELDVSELKRDAPVEVGQCYLISDATTTAFLDELETEVGDTSSFRKALTDFLDSAQLSLDIAGLIPGVGLIPDVANAVISTCRGNFGEACLSLAAAVPVVGQGVTAGKLASRVEEVVELASKAADKVNEADKTTPALHAIKYENGAHTTFTTHNGKVIRYETKIPQTNAKNPNPWEMEKRFDGIGNEHFNKKTKQDVLTPHIHDPKSLGGVRSPHKNELPKGYE